MASRLPEIYPYPQPGHLLSGLPDNLPVHATGRPEHVAPVCGGPGRLARIIQGGSRDGDQQRQDCVNTTPVNYSKTRHENNLTSTDRGLKMWYIYTYINTTQYYSTIFVHFVVQSLSCVQLCDPLDCSMPSFPVLHHIREFAQSHVH